MRKTGLENLIHTGQIESKKVRGKQYKTYLVNLNKWMVEQGLRKMTKKQNLLRAMEARKLWRAMIANVLKGHGT